MGFEHGTNTKVYIAQYDLTAYFRSVEAGAAVTLHETQTLGDQAVEVTPGLASGSVTLDGLFDAVLDPILAGYLASAAGQAVTVAYGGGDLGDRCRLGTVRAANYKSSAPVGDMVTAAVELTAHGGLHQGIILHKLEDETASGSETSVNSGIVGGTLFGVVAALHCTTVTGTNPTLDVHLEHSSDDSAWTTLCDFTQLVAAGSQVMVNATTPVKQYLRSTIVVAGTLPHFTFALAVARRVR